MPFKLPHLAICLFIAASGGALAQGAQASFGNPGKDSDAPIEVTSETLNVNRADNTALFTGDVVIAQGAMRLSAPRVLVVYLEDASGIERLRASGGVTLVSGEDAAEAEHADYNVESGIIEMQGGVLLLQGSNAVSGDRMTVNTRSGTAQMSGRVKTVIRKEADKP
mgnify:CR=1 FL=1